MVIIICLAPGLEIRSVQPGMVVQDGWACAAWVCCSVLIKILINYSTVLFLLNVLLKAAFANEPIFYAILWYPCALAYLLCGLLSMSYAHSCNIQSSEEEYLSEGDDLED